VRARLTLVAVALFTAACSAGPDTTTEQGEEFEGLWSIFLPIAVGVVLLIWGLVAWCVLRYRRKPDDDELPNQGGDRPKLELAYTVVPFLLVIFLFTISVVAERRINERDDEPDLVVEVVGYRWDWRFTYVDSGVVVDAAPDQRPVLVLPVGRTIRFELTTPDVAHSFWVPEFGTKRDLIPRVDNQIDVDITEAGTWTGRCAEYCGLDHTSMDFEVQAIDGADFDAWLANQEGEETAEADR
jgi:cytochrome c oxidase subunit 2